MSLKRSSRIPVVPFFVGGGGGGYGRLFLGIPWEWDERPGEPGLCAAAAVPVANPTPTISKIQWDGTYNVCLVKGSDQLFVYRRRYTLCSYINHINKCTNWSQNIITFWTCSRSIMFLKICAWQLRSKELSETIRVPMPHNTDMPNYIIKIHTYTFCCRWSRHSL